MAVVIQQIVGGRHGDYLYPDIAGVARSHNFYPIGGMKADAGVICPALGLGKTVVEGGRCLRFSPENPKSIYDILTPRDYLNNAQREFFAIDLRNPGPNWNDVDNIGSNIALLDMESAVEHGTFDLVGQVYSSRDRTLYPADHRPGVKLVTMKKIFDEMHLPLAETLSYLLSLGRAGLSCPVEIEFAASYRPNKRRPLELSVLQIRPMVIDMGGENVDIKAVRRADAICQSDSALGHGAFAGIRDIVYVSPHTFNRAATQDIAEDIGQINDQLKSESRPYLLIGPGRWGSADWRLGIPVTWSQISNTRCIVETELRDLRVSPSQGSHFFQNMTSFGIGYITINTAEDRTFLDIDWLESRTDAVVQCSPYVRHIRLDEPIDVAIDSRASAGVITKPGIRAPRRSAF